MEGGDEEDSTGDVDIDDDSDEQVGWRAWIGMRERCEGDEGGWRDGWACSECARYGRDATERCNWDAILMQSPLIPARYVL